MSINDKHILLLRLKVHSDVYVNNSPCEASVELQVSLKRTAQPDLCAAFQLSYM